MSTATDVDPSCAVFDEPLLYKGVCSTIDHLKGKGLQLSFGNMQSALFINLEYYDDFGNEITSKEAYKQLSRKFHGRELGKSKRQKLLPKMKEERAVPKKSAPKTKKRIFGMP